MDGTLLDSEEAVLLSFQETLYRKTGKKTDIRDLKYALGIPSEAALRQYGFPEEEIPEIVDFWGDLTPDYRKFIKVFPGIRKLLEKLKENGARLGIVTSRNAEEYRRDFLPFGLEGYFDTVICADDTLIHKPYGEPVKEYLRRENARAEDAVLSATPFMIWTARRTREWTVRWLSGAVPHLPISGRTFTCPVLRMYFLPLCWSQIP